MQRPTGWCGGQAGAGGGVLTPAAARARSAAQRVVPPRRPNSRACAARQAVPQGGQRRRPGATVSPQSRQVRGGAVRARGVGGRLGVVKPRAWSGVARRRVPVSGVVASVPATVAKMAAACSAQGATRAAQRGPVAH
ncbi:MAG TPA: hypothetical protein VNG12_12950 [Acidimicrobiales bacterium]|nr:hypothetical protein [Acidimicrobiales bacterium]